MKSLKALFAASVLMAGFGTSIGIAQAQPVFCQGEYVLVADGVGGDGAATVTSNPYRNKSGIEVRDMPDNLVFTDVFDSETRKGTDFVKGHVNQIKRDCPDSKVYIVGHSLGALEAGDAVEELSDEGTDLSNVKVDLLADPRHPNTGVEANIPNVIPGLTMQGNRESFGNADVRQTCRDYDGVCDFDPPLVDQVQGFAGYLNGSHSVYPIPSAPPAKTEEVWVASPPPIRYDPPAYVPTPVRDYVPVEVQQFVPQEVLSFIPPPLPVLPPLF